MKPPDFVHVYRGISPMNRVFFLALRFVSYAPPKLEESFTEASKYNHFQRIVVFCSETTGTPSWVTPMSILMGSAGSCGVQATKRGTTMVPSRGTPQDLGPARRGGRAVSALQKAFDAPLARVGRSWWPDELQRVQRTRSGSGGTLWPARRSTTG